MGLLANVDPVFSYLLLSAALKYYVNYLWKDVVPNGAKLVGVVTGLELFPLKSGKGIEQEEVKCSSHKGPSCGPVTDRHWMVVTDKHQMVSSRQEPLLSRIVPRFEGSTMIITAPGCDDLSLDPDLVERAAKPISTDVHSVPTMALDCGEEASQWISKYLDKPGYRLVYSGRDVYTRGVVGGNNKYLAWTRVAKSDDKLAFHDSISLHLITEESVADLNKRLENPLKTSRFRPNIVAKTGSEPYAEDNWKEVYIGTARLRTLKLCARCVLPNVDPETGLKDPDDQPLKTLNRYRNILGGILGPALGIDLIVEKPGIVHVGDEIYAIRGDNITPP
ncbi:hypothetical protein LSH36_463g05002 [Paralvinella palmiformis]|uniref:MOSC domain-containing protein n=1 Tax=Paralvinella palmiformis TaxID=53620 RepID=A0AAD9JAH8_9ANNE|nr:hypothetical protein LSH36_463g05002 [Paralvinella palmiformis]